MSDLWAYSDDADADGPWQGPSQPDDDHQETEEDDDRPAKRKGGRKGTGKAGAQPAKRSRKGGKEPEPVQQPQPEVFVLSDDEDDLLVLPTTAANSRDATTGGQAGAPGATTATRPATRNLDPKTQQSLQLEHELLQVLQMVTQPRFEPGDSDLSPLQVRTRRPPLPLTSLKAGGHNKPAADASGSGGCGSATISEHDGGAAGPSGRADAAPRASSDANPPMPATEAADLAPADGDRVLLRFRWGVGKDCQVKLRLLRSDPISKVLDKFRQVAKEQQLCGDTTKARFMFEGDDLSKTPNGKPDDLGLDDDVVIDVKL